MAEEEEDEKSWAEWATSTFLPKYLGKGTDTGGEPIYLEGEISLTCEEEYINVNFMFDFTSIYNELLKHPDLLKAFLFLHDLEEEEDDEEVPKVNMKLINKALENINERWKSEECPECEEVTDKQLERKGEDKVIVRCDKCGTVVSHVHDWRIWL